jgi:hypothetical protein
MNKNFKKIGIFILVIGVITGIVFLILYLTQKSPQPPNTRCDNTNCVKLDPNSSCKLDTCQCNFSGSFPKCLPSGGESIDITDQPEKTIQLVNNTSEDPLHIFLGIKNDLFNKIKGNGTVYNPIFFDPNHAWNPVGTTKLSEVMIPKNGYIILQLPDDSKGNAFRVSPIKMLSDNDKPLSLDDKRCNPENYGSTYCKIATQWPVLLEGGMNVVADSSAVDGINFKLQYQLTSENGKILTMKINENPCDGLDSKYKLNIGCRSPAKIDCDPNIMGDKLDTTADCCTKDQVVEHICPSADQVCKFNDCSQKLFQIPDNLKKYIGNYDKGNSDPGGPPVKNFVENPENLKQGSAQLSFCNKIQKDTGDFTTYCYDYNDTNSSHNLLSPYKMKLVVSDL